MQSNFVKIIVMSTLVFALGGLVFWFVLMPGQPASQTQNQNTQNNGTEGQITNSTQTSNQTSSTPSSNSANQTLTQTTPDIQQAYSSIFKQLDSQEITF